MASSLMYFLGVDNALEKIRTIRNLKDPHLKPSPYLKEKYVNDYGEEEDVHVRDYQAQMILNLCMSPRFLNGDATGLGKTLEVLSAIGYIWLKEPEYVPIIITKKSALYQWENETKKFMKNMSAVTIDQAPFKRDHVYEDFFLNHDPNRKRLLILTYEIMFRDLEESVIRNRSKPPSKALKAKLKKARKIMRTWKAKLDEAKEAFDVYFKDRDPAVFEYVKNRIQPADSDAPLPAEPSGWTPSDELAITSTIKVLRKFRAAEVAVNKLNDIAAPPTRVPGILNYILELLKLNPNTKLIFIIDEIHTLKNHKSKTHKAAASIAQLSDRVVGMTATPVENRLMEFFSIFRIIQPKLFPMISHFQNEFCITRLQPIGGGRKVPIVTGYRNLDSFVSRIEPFYLARQKHEVAEQLPQLITRELTCELSSEQEMLYDLAEDGLLSYSDDADVSETEILSSLVMMQQAVDAPQLLSDEDGNPFEGASSKIEVLMDQLQYDLHGTKTIIFSRFEKMITLIEKAVKKAKIKYGRITGKENAKKREKNKANFQNQKSEMNIILMTTAGSESINLQAAENLVFVDLPWSWGKYVQLTGRMVRIGSIHKTVVATILMGVRSNGKRLMDNHVLKTLRKKQKLADKVAGISLKDGLEISKVDAMDIFNSIRAERQGKPKRKVTKKIQSTSSRKKPTKPIPKKPAPEKVAITTVDLSDI